MLYSKFLLLVLIGSLIIGCSSFDSTEIIAIVGKDKIAFDEFEAYLIQNTGKTNLKSVNPESRVKHFDDYINISLVAQLAAEKHFNDSINFIESLKNKEVLSLAQYLYWHELMKRLYTPEEENNFYQRMNKTVFLKNILIAVDEKSKTGQSKEEARTLAFEVKDKIISDLYDFSDLVKKYSSSPTARTNGLMRPFGVGDRPEIENIAFELKPGECSDPVLTKVGYEILVLDSFKVNYSQEDITNINEYSRLAHAMIAKKPKEREKLFQALTDSFKVAMNFSYDEENIKWLSIRLKELKETKFRILRDKIASEVDQSKALFYYNSKEFSIKNLFDALGVMKLGYIKTMLTPEGVKKILNRGDKMFIWSEMARVKGFEKSRYVTVQIKNFERVRLNNLYKIIEIEKKLKLSDNEMESYYHKNSKNYQIPRKILISVIKQGDIEIAAKALKKAMEGKNWENLVKEYSQASMSDKSRGGRIGFYSVKSKGEISKKAFEYGKDTIIPELDLEGNTFYIIKTGNIVEKHTTPFPEVKNKIMKELKEKKIEREYRVTIEKQKSKTKVQVINDTSEY